MGETASVVGFIPAISRREQTKEAARAILEETVDVHLALGRCDLGPGAGQVFATLGRIQRQARELMADGERPAPVPTPAGSGILIGYSRDIRDQIEALTELMEPVLEASWPPGMGANADDDKLRYIGQAALALAHRVEAYLALRSVADDRRPRRVSAQPPRPALPPEQQLQPGAGNYARERFLAAVRDLENAKNTEAADGGVDQTAA